ncbi:S-adenosyl-L-methionine-dependent methyltransferase [Glomus cerebriforme]|uniref:S-adenosyl-L-methionine-dependent methyltransferase n=1 Tax=Glomus cerebriforme TaxID=658196 RepID=A0A397S6V4_9GLOM|nr:S-adenosyl-L-methionine-dependent methyltransferase [Glomus cerebriforme]RIA81232.1 S-adenosyl-L-methionine-dependent methyltransferase [Glomus cerebriforme]
MGNFKSILKKTLSNPSKRGCLKSEPESQILIDEKPNYYLSNRGDENIDRQHFNHFFRKHIYGNNFSAPIGEKLAQGGCKVLDIGCGPGTWLLDLAHKYRNSKFVGVDIEPTVYPNEIKPGNLNFCEADILNGLPFPDNEFDFVHQEIMALIIKADQWNFVISEIVRVTKPGGFIELVEYIAPNNNGPILSKVYQTHYDLCLKRGVDTNLIPKLDTIMKSHNDITEVNRDEKTFIIGPNGGRVGITILDIIISFITSEIATEDISSQEGINKEEHKNRFKNLKEESKTTNPKLKLCRFWTQKNC